MNSSGKPVHFAIGVVLKSNENTLHSPLTTDGPDAIQCEVLNTYCTFYIRSYALFVGQKLTRLNLMHRHESYGIAQQLMPWLHRTPGHAIVILLIMKIDSEGTPL